MYISLPALETFVNGLIDEKFSGQNLDDSVRADIRRELTERLNQYLTLRTIEIISTTNPDAVSKLAELIKTNPAPDDVQIFISTYVNEPDVVVARIFSDFRTLYIGNEKKTN